MTDAAASADDAPVPARWDRIPDAWPGIAVVAITVVAAFVAGRNLWFFSDDWNIIASYHRGRVLEPFNSHLSMIPVGAYQLLFHTFGLGSYTPYRIVGLAAYAVLGWTTWRFARAYIGTWGATLATAAVLWNSGGVTNVMFPFLLNFSLPVAALVGAWWHLDRRTTRHDVAASAWVVVALATSGLGLMVVVALGVELVWTAVADRRVDWRRWLTLAPGPVLWFAWYLAYGVDSPASGGLRPILSYSFRMLLGGVGSLVGGSQALGSGLLVALVALAVVSVVRGTIDARLAGALAAPIAFAVLTAVSRIGVIPSIPPDELRYQWTIGAFIVFGVVIMLGSLRRTEPETWALTTRPLAGLVTVAVVAGAIVLVDHVSEWNDTVEGAVPGVRDSLWVAEVAAAADRLDTNRQLPVSYVRVTAGEYVDAVDDLGSPLDGLPPDAYGGSADSRNTADVALVQSFGIGLEPAGTGECAESELVTGSVVVPPGSTIRLDGGHASLPGGAAISLFGDGTAPEVALGVIGTEPQDLRLPALPEDRPVEGYRLFVDGAVNVAVCDA